MTLRNLLTVNAVVSLAYALGMLLVPATLLSLYGIAIDPGARLMAQFFGTSLAAIGLLSWLARDAADSAARQAIITAFLISDAIGVVIALLGTLSGVMSAMGWTAVAIYLILALGYAYFQFMKPVPRKGAPAM